MNKKIFTLMLIVALGIFSLLTGAQEDNKAAFELAEQGVTSNDEWEPVIQEFDGVEMVLVPAGSFMMGSTEDEFDDAVQQCVDEGNWPTDLEGCLHVVSFTQSAHEQPIEQPFWIDRFEVTNELYGGAATENGSFGSDDPCGEASFEPNQPRNCVTWYDAKAFCESRDMRLPTEREWEYAARGPDNLVYPWGNEYVSSFSVNFDNAALHTADVGSIPQGASWVRAMDMSGNLWEWQSTIWVITENKDATWEIRPDETLISYPYDAEDGREDLERTDTRRVLRGGGFYIGQPFFMRSASRGGNPSDIKCSGFGFRCAMSYEG